MMTPGDLTLLRHAIDLAREAKQAGDQPFGSLLVSGEGQVLAEERNSVVTERDVTAHPELKLARWASRALDVEERRRATVYTSGEHCPMCAVAHANAGIGRLVFAFSSRQLAQLTGDPGWRLPVRDLFDRRGLDTVVEGPATELTAEVTALHTPD
ncbi:MAG: nucleoside deaminase [Nitriliruptor sp.]|nr:MAG: nucleoside deaminase [Nitriliruptor sp.]